MIEFLYLVAFIVILYLAFAVAGGAFRDECQLTPEQKSLIANAKLKYQRIEKCGDIWDEGSHTMAVYRWYQQGDNFFFLTYYPMKPDGPDTIYWKHDQAARPRIDKLDYVSWVRAIKKYGGPHQPKMPNP